MSTTTWSCQRCGQNNAGSAPECGRCGSSAPARWPNEIHEPSTYEIETFSGRYIDLFTPKPEQVALEDIAHGLSMTCRFGGQTRCFYSVAEHAVLVADKLAAEGFRDVALAGLHHDDAEAYLGDVPQPLKAILYRFSMGDGELSYGELEQGVDTAIRRALGSHGVDIPEVKQADAWALMVEAAELMPSGGEGWVDVDSPWPLERPRVPPLRELTGGIPRAPWRTDGQVEWNGRLKPESAENLWLRRHMQLIGVPA